MERTIFLTCSQFTAFTTHHSRKNCSTHIRLTLRTRHIHPELARNFIRMEALMFQQENENFMDDRLQRGEACLPCRRRKTKCDGVRPICKACRPGNRLCKYTSARPVSTQYLEDEISQLHFCIHELEEPARDAVILQDPYAAYSEAQTTSEFHSPHVHQHSTGDVLDSDSLGRAISLHMNHHVSSMLVAKFFEHGELLGFCLDKSRFIEQHHVQTSNPGFSHTALLSTIYIWALRILNSSASFRLLPLYIAEATRALTNARDSSDPRTRVQTIQAEVLLAIFFYSNGRIVEGQIHSAGAVNMVLSSGLHCTNPISADSSSGSGNMVPTTTFLLPQPCDAAEAAERTRLFWAVYSLDACWPVVTRSPSKLRDSGNPATTITIPWPASTDECQSMNLGGMHAINNTFQEFYANRPSPQSVCGMSSSTLRAQTSVLLKHVTELGESENADDTQRKIRDMARFISSFISNLPSVSAQSDVESVVLLTNLVTRSLAHAAEIQLHLVYRDLAFSPGSLTVCINSALAILSVMEDIIMEERDCIDPAIVVAWTVAAKLLVSNGRGEGSPVTRTCNSASSRFISSLTAFMRICPMMETLVQSVLEIFGRI
ncbi:hypothetical protein BD410DRAFT_828850 [Rickenella mellea]|uniref:Zn(2)-C6 fungal-type domain-containing protein n=1 Tax=Rickenella mellea TaxID=50990 RepID=A0A4Y7Q3L5_9AGAM|nr:hypothetical protein BD410DRAFT_828850 [Rickenella mellea]